MGGLGTVLMSRHVSAEDLVRRFMRRASPPTLRLDNFSHLSSDSDALRRYLRNAMDENVVGVKYPHARQTWCRENRIGPGLGGRTWGGSLRDRLFRFRGEPEQGRGAPGAGISILSIYRRRDNENPLLTDQGKRPRACKGCGAWQMPLLWFRASLCSRWTTMRRRS